MFAWLVLFGSTWIYQLFLGTVAARLFDPSLLPRLSLLWVCVLADRSPSTAARETDMWVIGLLASCFLGYLIDVSVGAPRGLHMGVYGVCFVLVRSLINRLGQSPRVLQLVLIGAITFGVDVLIWWIKGLTLGFVNFSQFDLVIYVIKAAVTGVFGALVFRAMTRLFAERESGSMRRL
jgi:rod shape-determining protein MreD